MPEAHACRFVRAYVALGSNLGNRSAHMADALVAIAAIPQTRFVARSSIHDTEPVGPQGQPRYLNAVVLVETRLAPRALLDALLAIERDLGRDRSTSERWGPRIIDLDLLLFGDQLIEEPGLSIPHPRLHERRFVLGPLSEIAADLPHPKLGQSIGELLAALRA